MDQLKIKRITRTTNAKNKTTLKCAFFKQEKRFARGDIQSI